MLVELSVDSNTNDVLKERNFATRRPMSAMLLQSHCNYEEDGFCGLSLCRTLHKAPCHVLVEYFVSHEPTSILVYLIYLETI